MTGPRVYILGASGSGTTTLGAALAAKLGVVHVDADSLYWAPVEPPFSCKAAPETRNAALARALAAPSWALSGACHGWGPDVAGHATLIVFLTLHTDLRLARLRARERALFGARIAPGGDMAAIHRDFIEWAAGYDDPDFAGRSRAGHEAWLAQSARPVLRLEGAAPVDRNAARVKAALSGR